MKCSKCGSRNVTINADGKAYCNDCMAEQGCSDLTLKLDKVLMRLDEVLETVSPEDQSLFLEKIQSWVYRKAEVL